MVVHLPQKTNASTSVGMTLFTDLVARLRSCPTLHRSALKLSARPEKQNRCATIMGHWSRTGPKKGEGKMVPILAAHIRTDE